MPHTVLPEVHCIAIEGPAARRFAQTQFSGDVDSLAERRWQWNAWLDAQGRVQALMHLADLSGDRLLAILRGGDAEKLRASLARYLFRAKAAVTAHIFGGYAGGPLPVESVDVGAQGIVIGYGERSLRLGPVGADADPEAANAWRLADIRAGWPTLPAGDARFLPPALGLQRLGAVSLGKGCYPGQEIVARLHYRGGHKFGLYRVRGPVGLEPGATFDRGGMVLYCAADHDTGEALIAAPLSETSKINILDGSYEVVSRYDA